jgi:hypothetical protein
MISLPFRLCSRRKKFVMVFAVHFDVKFVVSDLREDFSPWVAIDVLDKADRDAIFVC